VFQTPGLNDFFISSYPSQKFYKPQRLSKDYYELIKKVKAFQTKGSSYDNTITPSDLKNSVSKVAPQFSGYG
jgi:hypothetical protein